MNYELLDSGGGRKLEKFGNIITDRPSPHSIWKKTLSKEEWREASAIFYKNKNRKSAWYFPDEQPADWNVLIDGITFSLNPSSNGQVGIFPEQLENWRWIGKAVKNAKRDLKILNGFAYTGGSTLFSAAASIEGQRVEVCHVDAAKSVVTRASKNASASDLSEKPIRWIVDDIVTFMQKEIKRGKNYDGIILDPPAFGKSKSGKTWSLKKQLPVLMELSQDLISDNPLFFLLSCHDPEISSLDLKTEIVYLNFPKDGKTEHGELIIPSQKGHPLPSGVYARRLFENE